MSRTQVRVREKTWEFFWGCSNIPFRNDFRIWVVEYCFWVQQYSFSGHHPNICGGILFFEEPRCGPWTTTSTSSSVLELDLDIRSRTDYLVKFTLCRIPSMHLPGLITPAQFGPTIVILSSALYLLIYLFTLIMS